MELCSASDLNVVLSQGDAQSVRVEAEKSDLPFINTKVVRQQFSGDGNLPLP